MLSAATYAFLDSLNVLLIGVLVAVGIMLPEKAAYRRISSLVIAGDWMGVFTCSIIVMGIFDGIGDPIKHLVESAIFGVVLLVVGIFTIAMTLRGGNTHALIANVVPPLKKPSIKTFFAGMSLGVAQSLTSVPFFAGIAVLSAGNYGFFLRYGGMLVYASIALSLPIVSAVLVGAVRAYPRSVLGYVFAYLRNHQDFMIKIAGYLVGIMLIILGIKNL